MLDQRVSALNMSLKENKGYATTTDLPLNKMSPTTDTPDALLEESGNKSVKQISQSKSIHVMYILVLVLLVILWLALAVKCAHLTKNSPSDTTQQKSEANNTVSTDDPPPAGLNHLGNAVLCDYKIRQLGNLQRYTVQCVYSVNSNDIDTDKMYSAPEINVVVCAVVAVLQFLHVLYTALISPLVNKNYTGQLLKGLGLSGQNILFSDLNILLMKKEQ